jgi:DNA adenine methylase
LFLVDTDNKHISAAPHLNLTKEATMKADHILRYPGGKQRAVERILPYIPESTTVLHSPFFGGGSIEFEWLARTTHGVVVGRDVFEPIVTFWRAVFSGHAEQVADEVQKYFPISKASFATLQGKLRSGEGSAIERAAWFYVINRSSFSGSTLSGGMGDGDRFTQSSIDRLRRFKHAGRIDYRSGDCFDGMRRRISRYLTPGACMYADPPYWLESSKLYGDKGSTHDSFNHKRFAEMVRNLSDRGAKIVVSYNDCQAVRDLYPESAGFGLDPKQWKYGMSSDKTGRELIILSKALAS